MAVGNYTVYNEAKKYIASSLNLATDVLYSALYKSTSNASTYTLSNISELTNVVNAAGYTGAKALTGVLLTAGASAKQIKFTSDNPVFTASAANITSIMYEVIYASGGKVLAWCKLSTAVFSVTSGNALTINRPANGVFNFTSTP